MKMKLLLLSLGSVILTGLVLASAFYQKKQFYPSVIYITKSNISMAAMYFQAFVILVLVSKLFCKIFFGQLRPTEIEHLVERMWYAITETCLAFTVFREDFSPKFVAMFTILLFFKCFHWLAEDRVDFMERSPVIPMRFHIRMMGLVGMLFSVNYFFIRYAYNYTMEKGPNAQLVFGFEYTILKLSLIVILCRYALHTIDSRRETPWDQKTTFMLYIDLISNLLKLLFYVAFLGLMVKVHTLPLFIIRPVYLSMRAFKKTVQDLILSRKAIHYMNTVFKTATSEDLVNTDTICIICREEMVAPSTDSNSGAANNRRPQTSHNSNVPKCLPCGHIFHCACLKTWFQRQQTCPTCRMDILRNVNAASHRANANRPNAAASSSGANNDQANNTSTQNVPNSANSSTDPTASNSVSQPASPFLPPNMMPQFPPGSFPWMMPPPVNNNDQSTSASSNFPNMFVPPFGGLMFPGGMTGSLFTRPMPEMSSAELAKLTDDELQKLEKQGREGMENRVKTLQQIHTLLDAAVLLMNAYMVSTNNMNIPTASAVPNNDEPEKGDKLDENIQEVIKEENIQEVIKDENIQEVIKEENIQEVIKEENIQEVIKEENTESVNAKSAVQENRVNVDEAAKTIETENIDSSNELMKIRDRRLKKFQSINNNTDSDDGNIDQRTSGDSIEHS